ncbi:MAG: hypothetical protein B5M54_05815 [Candidatus Aminicenantes bacterium 4484_214]|nr:MAG: hypothetical protein B5M54_05815 [Candidatus Aminicenantes bacterium 4484_214]RLE09959.1 MAG: hypothetical protein DRJ06_01895 [Candidatus Aminicenantes bacterium]
MTCLHTKLTLNNKFSLSPRKRVFSLGLIILGIFCQCRVPSLYLEQVPSQITTMEGYASLVIKDENHLSRSKVSFFVLLPDRARLDIADPLGRTRAQILFLSPRAYLVLPGKKVYWEGREEELFANFFGLTFTWREWNNLLINQEALAADWQVTRDVAGRIRQGSRENLTFEIQNYAQQTAVVTELKISFPRGEVRWRLTKILFNHPSQAGIFSLDFMNRYQRQNWAEMEEFLK